MAKKKVGLWKKWGKSVVLFVVLILLGLGYSFREAIFWKKYVDDDQNFSFKYPATWTLQENKNLSDAQLLVMSSLENYEGNLSTQDWNAEEEKLSVGVNKYKLEVEHKSIKEFAELREKESGSNGEIFEVNNGMYPSILIVRQNTHKEYEGLDLLISKEGEVYEFRANIFPDQSRFMNKYYFGLAKVILSSIQFTKK